MLASVIELSEPARRLMFAFAVSQVQLTATFVVATLLQTRAPTGKNSGPEAGLLLSSPTTFQVSGVTVSVAWAAIGKTRPAKPATSTRREEARNRSADAANRAAARANLLMPPRQRAPTPRPWPLTYPR